MSSNYLVYPLNNGYIHNWLVAGPQSTPILSPDRTKDDEITYKLQIAHQFYREGVALSEPPVDQGISEINGEKLTWNYIRCHEDHFVDVSNSYPNWQHLQTWAYTVIKSSYAIPVTMVLTTRGPADIWLNGNHIHHQEKFSPDLFSIRIPASLKQENNLLVRFNQVAVRECENVMAFQIVDLPANETDIEISICVPTNARYPLRHQALELMFENAYLEEVVNHRGAHFNLRWAEDLQREVTYDYKIMDSRNLVYVDGTWRTDATKPVDVGHNFRLLERPYFVTLMAPLKEFFEHNLRYTRKLPIHVLDNAYSISPYKDITQRRLEALEDATKFETDLFAEIAKMELNRWSELKPDRILVAVEQVNQRINDSDILLVGLLGIMHRYQNNPSFPDNLNQPIEDCILKFEYKLPVFSTSDTLDFSGESHTILIHTCEILAGQLYLDRIFSNSQQTGLWHFNRGGQLALDWMRQRASNGFTDWDSNYYYEQVILALSYLASLAESELLLLKAAICDMASVLLDKMIFTLAVNSFKGAFGASHGRTHASMIKSAQLEATSGICRLLWGMGVFNHHILGTVGLACSNYEFPAFFTEIATKLPEEMWCNERNRIITHGSGVTVPGESEINRVTYKTPDYMLSSAQDYHPGSRGSHEHIWQATMGSDAVVFTNHPACMSESEAHYPGFWRGNAVLPRVAQWKEMLIAVYNFPEQDWMGFTHAYFPIYAFDEHAFSEGWAFARKDNGYLALTSARGFELNRRGPDGYRELRSYGHKNVWVCQMGRRAIDGDFKDFQDRVTRMPLNFQDLAVQMVGLHSETLAFGWEGPLMVNEIEQPITGFKHIDNPYCSAELPANQMDIRYGEYLLRLNFI